MGKGSTDLLGRAFMPIARKSNAGFSVVEDGERRRDELGLKLMAVGQTDQSLDHVSVQ